MRRESRVSGRRRAVPVAVNREDLVVGAWVGAFRESTGQHEVSSGLVSCEVLRCTQFFARSVFSQELHQALSLVIRSFFLQRDSIVLQRHGRGDGTPRAGTRAK